MHYCVSKQYQVCSNVVHWIAAMCWTSEASITEVSPSEASIAVTPSEASKRPLSPFCSAVLYASLLMRALPRTLPRSPALSLPWCPFLSGGLGVATGHRSQVVGVRRSVRVSRGGGER